MNIYGGGPAIVREKPYIYSTTVILKDHSQRPSISKVKKTSEEKPKVQITQLNLEKLKNSAIKQDVVINAISAMGLMSPTDPATPSR